MKLRRWMLCLTLLCAAHPARAEDLLKPVTRNPAVKKALASVDAGMDSMVEEWVRLAEISAPSRHEDARAEYMMHRFRELGLRGVRRDGCGNVVGLLPGKNPSGKFIVFDAHLDTVAQPGVEIKVRREDGKLHGAGVGDDTAGLIGLLYMLEALRECGVALREDVVFTASVQEEIGLLGAECFVGENADKISQFVSVDGGLGSVSYGATCIYWFKFHYKSGGAHTLSSHGKPSTTHAAARAIDDLYAFAMAALPREPEEKQSWLNVGMLGGGEVPNAQSRDSWFSVDLRSNSPEVMAELEKKVIAIARAAAETGGVDFEMEMIQKLEGAQIPGHKDSILVKTALAAMQAAGVKDAKASILGSSNHNAAIKRGIPGVNVGVTTGEGAHTPTEWCDTAPAAQGVKQLVLMACSLAGLE